MRLHPMPWWVAIPAAGYALYLALLAWCGFFGPAWPGIEAAFEGSGMVVLRVEPGSAAMQAGIRPGDLISLEGGHRITSRFEWMAREANWRVGESVTLMVTRGGVTSRGVLQVPSRSWKSASLLSLGATLLMWVTRLLTLCAAYYILLRGRSYVIARLGAWFLASCAVATVVLLPGMALAWRAIPLVVSLLMWFPVLSALSLPAIFFTFYLRFPGTLPIRPWVWAAVWAPQVALAVVLVLYLAAAVYWPGSPDTMLPGWFAYLFAGVATAYLVAGVAVQLAKRRLLASPNDSRTAGLLAAGSVLGWCAAAPIVVLDWHGRASSVAPALLASKAAIASMGLFLLCLVLLSYVLLRKQVFGFEVMIRLGLRYALARRVLVSLAPACAVFLVLDLFIHGDQPLTSILQARGWVYGIVACLAIFAKSRRQIWLDALDRRFFRERYHAQQLLREVADLVRQAGSFDQAAPQVVTQIASAVHAEWVAIMAKSPAERDYRCIAAEPPGHGPQAIPGDSRFVSFLRVLGRPIEMTISSQWLREQLPHQDTDFIRGAHIQLLVPVASNPGCREALLAAGPKRSEEPYTGEDQDLLAAIGANLSLLLERPAAQTVTVSTHSFHECPKCGTCFDDNVAVCAADSEALVPRPLPRHLSGRYRLERRLGAGGMGTVYEALDMELERRVAVKLLHETLVGDQDAASRFRREAKAAATFSHPNIVTIFDFGVVAATRAYLVMELLNGVNLRERLKSQRRLTAPAVCAILRGVCDAVETAHRQRMIHRDLKPENIFLASGDDRETPKILDFGIVKVFDSATGAHAGSNTESGVLVGTLRYMSPEQLRGGPPRPSWDIWALAVIAFEMITGTHPYQDLTPSQWFAAAREGSGSEFSAFLADVPIDLEEFFAGALSHRPEQRPASAGDLFAELEKLLLPTGPFA